MESARTRGGVLASGPILVRDSVDPAQRRDRLFVEMHVDLTGMFAVSRALRFLLRLTDWERIKRLIIIKLVMPEKKKLFFLRFSVNYQYHIMFYIFVWI